MGEGFISHPRIMVEMFISQPLVIIKRRIRAGSNTKEVSGTSNRRKSLKQAEVTLEGGNREFGDF